MKNLADNDRVNDEHSEINIESMEDEDLVKPTEIIENSSEQKVIVENTILTNLYVAYHIDTNL